METPSLPILPKNDAERRHFPRFNMALDVSFGPTARTNGHPTPLHPDRSFTVNISLGGLCVYSDTLYPIGAELVCTVTVPGRVQPIEAVGTMAWVQELDQHSPAYKLGIEFSEISRENQTALQALFDRPPAAKTSRRSKRLLLVDDDEEFRLALKLRFEASGFRVSTASDGVEALRKGQEERPHLIILDLMLPQLNGYEVCRRLKFDQKFRHIPIILCTARRRRDDQEKGMAVGADAYITKPFSGDELLTQVTTLLKSAGS